MKSFYADVMFQDERHGHDVQRTPLPVRASSESTSLEMAGRVSKILGKQGLGGERKYVVKHHGHVLSHNAAIVASSMLWWREDAGGALWVR